VRYVALLRGINVGGKNKVPMKDLVEVFEGAGATDVETYIQSGNVVYTANKVVDVEKAFLKRFKFVVPVVSRTHKELQATVDRNPFVKAGADVDTLHVMFCADKPKNVDTLDPNRSPGDEFVVVGSDIYLRAPNGMGRSKLTNAYFDSKLATTTTIRNWRTVQKLLDML
jgi:uncharacterized protein (DUF1697 family)